MVILENCNFIAKLFVDTDAKNNSYRVLTFDQADLGLSKEYWDKGMEEPEVKAYFQYMIDTAVLFGANEEIARSELEEVMNFESKLAKISAPKEERRNDTKLYNPTTLGEMSTDNGKIFLESWTTYVSDLFHFDVFLTNVVY